MTKARQFKYTSFLKTNFAPLLHNRLYIYCQTWFCCFRCLTCHWSRGLAAMTSRLPECILLCFGHVFKTVRPWTYQTKCFYTFQEFFFLLTFGCGHNKYIFGSIFSHKFQRKYWMFVWSFDALYFTVLVLGCISRVTWRGSPIQYKHFRVHSI